VDNAVEVQHNIGVQVVYSLVGELAASFLVLLDVSETVSLEFPEEELGLLVKVVFLNFLHEFFDLHLFLLDEIVEGQLHPHKHGIHVAALLLNAHVLLPI
jgi:hypothetical protein